MVSLEPHDSCLIFYLSGNVDISDAQAFEEMVENAFREGKSRFLFDFSRVECLHSSGVRALLLICKEVQKRKGKMILACLHDNVLKTLDIIGLRTLFEIVDSRDEAIARME